MNIRDGAARRQEFEPPASGAEPPDRSAATSSVTDRYRWTMLAVAFSLFALAAGIIYLDRDEWAVALAQPPQARQAAPAFDGPGSAGPRAFPAIEYGLDRAPDFDVRRLTIPRDEIQAGGPPKDGIPALTNPRFLGADEARDLRPGDRVVGVAIAGEARAYPLAILTWHEIVNDTIQGQPIAVTYCPLCDAVAVFDRRTPDGVKEFGVSGLLYNSNVLMYDRGGRPEALWSQIQTKAVSGPKAGQELKTHPVELTTWADWHARHPATKVLSPHSGHNRDYRTNPYADYFNRPGLMFPVQPVSDRLPEKAPVLGVWSDGGVATAYPLAAFADQSEPLRIQDQIDGRRLTIMYNPEARSLRVEEADEGLQWMYAFWFAWYAFHPETEVFPRR